MKKNNYSLICDCGRQKPNHKLFCPLCGQRVIKEVKEHRERVDEIDQQIDALEKQKAKLEEEFSTKRVPRAPFNELVPELQIHHTPTLEMHKTIYPIPHIPRKESQ